jgi:acetyl-CoA carboxylase carboxyl transferase subunit beta
VRDVLVPVATSSGRLAWRDEATPAAPRPAWDQVLLARHGGRPSGGNYLAGWLRRPLRRGSDPTVLAGLAAVDGRRVIVIAQHRHAADGRTRPEGFRRARGAIGLAVRLGLPVVTLVDTPGANPGAESEADGLAREIALTFGALLRAPVPTVACVVGEGGSGGALALSVCDRVVIQENAVFSVIAPEGAAAILRRDDLALVAEDLRLTAADLRRFGLADAVVREPPGGAHADPASAAEELAAAVHGALHGLDPDLAARGRRWRTWRAP